MNRRSVLAAIAALMAGGVPTFAMAVPVAAPLAAESLSTEWQACLEEFWGEDIDLPEDSRVAAYEARLWQLNVQAKKEREAWCYARSVRL